MIRRHHALVRLLARLLQAAGYHVTEETWEPRWDRPKLDRRGNQEVDAEGNPQWVRARLDLRLMAPPEEPLVYGDVVVSHPGAPSNARAAAETDGATARKAALKKARRYPPEEVPNARLVALAVETGGRWDPDAVDFLKKAAGRAAQRHQGLSSLEGGGAAAVFATWLRQLACTLQRANVAALRGAAAAGARAEASALRAAGERGSEAAEEEEEEDEDENDWLLEQIEELLVGAKAAAGA